MRNLPTLTIPQLEYLVAVADAPTWAAAASELGVTPSALSQGLAELERRLGMELFDRNGRRRLVAPRARPVVDYARRVLAQTGDLARWIDAAVSGATGQLRVGLIDAAAIGHFPQQLESFRTAHPDIDFTLTVAPSGNLLNLLRDDELDLAVVVKPAEQPVDVEWTELLEEPLAVYAPSSGADHTRLTTPDAWGPWVAFPASSHTRQLIATALRKRGASFEVVAESSQPDVLREMVRLGMGWTVLPVIQAEIPGQPELRRVQDDPLLSRSLVAARRAGAIDNPLATQLTSLLREGTP